MALGLTRITNPALKGAGVKAASVSADNKTISGVGAKAGATINVYRNGTSVGSATADSSGAWSLVLGTALSSGDIVTYDGVLLSPSITIPLPLLSMTGTPYAAVTGVEYYWKPDVVGLTGLPGFTLTGSLPTGLSFYSATGAIAGTPTAAGSASIGIALSVAGITGIAATLSVSVTVADYTIGDPLGLFSTMMNTGRLRHAGPMLTNPIEPGVAAESGRPGTGIDTQPLKTQYDQRVGGPYNSDNDVLIIGWTNNRSDGWFSGRRAAHAVRHTGKKVLGDFTKAMVALGARYLSIEGIELTGDNQIASFTVACAAEGRAVGNARDMRFGSGGDGWVLACKGGPDPVLNRVPFTIGFDYVRGGRGWKYAVQPNLPVNPRPVSSYSRTSNVGKVVIPATWANYIPDPATCPLIGIFGLAANSLNGYFPFLAATTVGSTTELTFTSNGPDIAATTPLTDQAAYGMVQGFKPSWSVANVVKSGTTITVTLQAAHGVTGTVGNGTINLWGVGGALFSDESGLNNEWVLSGIPSTTSFTATVSGAGAAVADGTYTGGIAYVFGGTTGALSGLGQATHSDCVTQQVDSNRTISQNFYPEPGLADGGAAAVASLVPSTWTTTRVNTGAQALYKGDVTDPTALAATSTNGFIYCVTTTNASATPPYTAGDGFEYVGAGNGTSGPGLAWNNIGVVAQTYTDFQGRSEVYRTDTRRAGNGGWVSALFTDMIRADEIGYDAEISGKRVNSLVGATSVERTRLDYRQDWNSHPHDRFKQPIFCGDGDDVPDGRIGVGQSREVFLSSSKETLTQLVFPSGGASRGGQPIGMLTKTAGARTQGYFPVAGNMLGWMTFGVPDPATSPWAAFEPSYANTGARYVPQDPIDLVPAVAPTDINFSIPDGKKAAFDADTATNGVLARVTVTPHQRGYICDVTIDYTAAPALSGRIAFEGRQLKLKGATFAPGDVISIPLIATMRGCENGAAISPALSFSKTIVATFTKGGYELSQTAGLIFGLNPNAASGITNDASSGTNRFQTATASTPATFNSVKAVAGSGTNKPQVIAGPSNRSMLRLTRADLSAISVTATSIGDFDLFFIGRFTSECAAFYGAAVGATNTTGANGNNATGVLAGNNSSKIRWGGSATNKLDLIHACESGNSTGTVAACTELYEDGTTLHLYRMSHNSAAKTLTFYRDGVVYSTANLTTTAGFSNVSSLFGIGSSGAGFDFMDVALFNAVLAGTDLSNVNSYLTPRMT